MDFSLWLIFATAYLGITLSPGPNVLLVLNHASRYGYRSIVTTMAGNLTCQLMIIAAVGLGVGVLLRPDTAAYQWLKYVGAAYLVYLGLRGLYDMRAGRKGQFLGALEDPSARAKAPPFGRRYLEAVAVSASNPKTVIFLSAFLPQFVTTRFSVALQFTIMFATIAITVVSVHASYAYLLVVLKQRMPSGLNRKIFPALSAGIFIFLGVGLGFSR